MNIKSVLGRLSDLFNGLYYRQPLCCTLRYSFGVYAHPGLQRGGTRTDRAGFFVPCEIFHHASADNPPQPEHSLYGEKGCPGKWYVFGTIRDFRRDNTFRSPAARRLQRWSTGMNMSYEQGYAFLDLANAARVLREGDGDTRPLFAALERLNAAPGIAEDDS